MNDNAMESTEQLGPEVIATRPNPIAPATPAPAPSLPAAPIAYTRQTAAVQASPKSWVRVASWSGDGIKSTETFTVGDEWAIQWATQPGQFGDMNFIIHTTPADGSLSDVDANIIGAGHDTSYKHQAGTYYLEINSGQRWEIQIWDKR